MKPDFSLAQDEEIDAEVARLVSTGIRIPPQPKIVFDVLTMLGETELDLRRIGERIGEDAGLTAMLYKITRSAAFSRGRSPQTIAAVLALLGARQIGLLVQSYGLTAAMPGDVKVLEQFWARSSGIARIASMLVAERLFECHLSPEQAYMIGIFHDCGVPVLMQRFPDYCRSTGLDGMARKWTDVRTEDRAFNVDHTSIGFLLARHWRLPSFVADAILHHHDVQACQDEVTRGAVAVLQLAIELFSREQGVDNPELAFFEQAIADDLGIYSEDIPDLAEHLLEAHRELTR